MGFDFPAMASEIPAPRTEAEARAASLTVCRYAETAEAARPVLEALGLVDPVLVPRAYGRDPLGRSLGRPQGGRQYAKAREAS